MEKVKPGFGSAALAFEGKSYMQRRQGRKKFPGFPKPTYPMVPEGLFDELLAGLKGGRR